MTHILKSIAFTLQFLTIRTYLFYRVHKYVALYIAKIYTLLFFKFSVYIKDISIKTVILYTSFSIT